MHGDGVGVLQRHVEIYCETVGVNTVDRHSSNGCCWLLHVQRGTSDAEHGNKQDADESCHCYLIMKAPPFCGGRVFASTICGLYRLRARQSEIAPGATSQPRRRTRWRRTTSSTSSRPALQFR